MYIHTGMYIRTIIGGTHFILEYWIFLDRESPSPEGWSKDVKDVTLP